MNEAVYRVSHLPVKRVGLIRFLIVALLVLTENWQKWLCKSLNNRIKDNLTQAHELMCDARGPACKFIGNLAPLSVSLRASPSRAS